MATTKYLVCSFWINDYRILVMLVRFVADDGLASQYGIVWAT